MLRRQLEGAWKIVDEGDRKTAATSKGKSDTLYRHWKERFFDCPDGIENFVICTFDPSYERYFTPIVERMGRSMRAVSSGMYERAARVTEPYRP